MPSLPKQLEAAGLTWKNYGGYAFSYIADLETSPDNSTPEQFAIDAAAGALPNVSWVYAPGAVNTGSLSEHPPASATEGVQWTVDQVNALVKGGLWPNSAIFITWDDYGGWYDHVVPPRVESWTDGTWFRYGSRVGCLVLSPYALSNHVSSTLHSHVSLVAFCDHVFALPSLNQRTASAGDMTDCFDFQRTPAPPPTP
jgi:phospholipase C